MTKYVIVKEPDTAYQYRWCAYKKIFGLWGLMTYVDGSLSLDSAEDCENNVRNMISKTTSVVKEIEL